MRRPRLLDLFCGAGGCSAGYHRAGFDVVGVDIRPMPRYPFEFHQADAMTYPLDGFDVVHASPPCQRYSSMSVCRPGLAGAYPDLIGAVRERLDAAGVLYVIENVEGARAALREPITLCGQMFGRDLYRHRLFESNVPLVQPVHPAHVKPGSAAGHWREGTVISVAGNCAPVGLAREVMAIGWTTRSELAEAVPPYFTAHVAASLLGALGRRGVAA